MPISPRSMMFGSATSSGTESTGATHVSFGASSATVSLSMPNWVGAPVILMLVVALAVAVYLPAALVRSSLRGSVGAGLEWRENVAFIRQNLANYALSLVAYLVAAFAAQFGVILCCVGFFPAAFWSYLVLAVALGQTVRLSGAAS